MKIQYQTTVKELRNDLGRKGVIDSIKSGEFDPVAGTFTIDFDDETLTELAIKQLELVRADLNDEVTTSNYVSAYSFLGTEQFISTCIAAGLNEDDARQEAEYLLRRYSSWYQGQLNNAVNLKPLNANICKSSEFAFELAVHLYKNHGKLSDLLERDTYWQYLAKNKVKSDIVKRHFEHLTVGLFL